MKKTLALALFSGVFSLPCFALEALNDAELSNKTGQDGITVSISGDGLTGIDSVRLIDGDGFQVGTVNQSQQAGVGINFSSSVRSCQTEAMATCDLETTPLTIVMDTDSGGANAAFVNVAITGAAKAFYVPINTLSLVGGTNDKGTWSNNINIISFENGVAVKMTNALSANLQLGEQPQGSMMLIGENSLDIDLGTLNILSYSDGDTTNKKSQVSTKLTVDKFAFSGLAVDIDGEDGIVLQSPGNTTIEKISVNDTVLGKANEANTSSFNGLQNASIGNISMTGVTIKNLQVNVKGL